MKKKPEHLAFWMTDFEHRIEAYAEKGGVEQRVNIIGDYQVTDK